MLPESTTAPPPMEVLSGRQSKIFVLVAVGLPTMALFLIVSGVLGVPEFNRDFPFFHLDWKAPTLFFANTPTGGDMGAHVLLPQILKENLLPAGRIVGWSDAFYAGFPAMYFYFPLPALFTVAVDVLIPYGVAFKLSVILGLVLFPASIYVLARGFGFSRIVSGFAAFGGSMYVFMESFAIYGGNLKSTFAGEFSFSWSLSLAFFYLGVVVKATREERSLSPLAGVLLALTAMSHVVTTVIVVIATIPLLFRRSGAKILSFSWALGLALSAAWALPLVTGVFSGLTTDMKWSSVEGWVGETFAPGIIATPLPDEFIPIAIVGLIGLVWTLIRRDDVSVLVMMTIPPLFLYGLLPELGFTAVYNGRLLPFWYLGTFIFASIALGLVVSSIARFYPKRKKAFVSTATLALIVSASVAGFGVKDAPGWITWNFEGYEGKVNYGDYKTLMETVDALPPGRVMWEHNNDINGRYGTPMALMLLPFFSPGHTSMEGVFFESSITTPFHFLNQSEVSEFPSQPVRGLNYKRLDVERAVSHLALYDVSYYISVTDKARDEAMAVGLVSVATIEPWTIFKLPQTSLVDVATRQPVVYDGEGSFADMALEWYDDVDSLEYWITAEGPDDWPRIEELDERFVFGKKFSVGGTVSDVIAANDRIEFTTDAIGVPHLVKVSYFPNWAVTDGGKGPYYAAPSLMVVVPDDERVVLQFQRSATERLGNFFSGVGIVGVAIWGWRNCHRRRDDSLLIDVR